MRLDYVRPIRILGPGLHPQTLKDSHAVASLRSTVGVALRGALGPDPDLMADAYIGDWPGLVSSGTRRSSPATGSSRARPG